MIPIRACAVHYVMQMKNATRGVMMPQNIRRKPDLTFAVTFLRRLPRRRLTATAVLALQHATPRHHRCHAETNLISCFSLSSRQMGRYLTIPPFPPSNSTISQACTIRRTWSPGYSNDVIPLPNLRELQQGGLNFRKHYANAPVCCPSRATFWSGRHASNIPHDHNGIAVGGTKH